MADGGGPLRPPHRRPRRRDPGGGGGALSRAGDRAALALATGLGAGLSPFAPGTVGTLVAVPLAWWLAQAGGWLQALGVGVVCLASIPLAGRASTLLGQKDPKPVVIDEVAGYLVATWGHPADAPHLLAAFLLFRLFDIAKPFPCRRLERLPGGWGIVLDDLAAGLYASAALLLARSVAW